MLTTALLKRMKRAALATALGGSALLAADAPQPQPAPPPKAEAPAAKLTPEQLKIFNENLAIDSSNAGKTGSDAFDAIVKLGEGALPLLADAIKKTDDELKQRMLNLLARRIRINHGGDPCPPCGMG